MGAKHRSQVMKNFEEKKNWVPLFESKGPKKEIQIFIQKYE